MFFRLLNVLDGVCFLTFVASHFFALPAKALYILAGYLLMKGIAFTLLFNDIASILDLVCGLYALAMVLGFSLPMLTTLAALYLLQKVVFSFIRLG